MKLNKQPRKESESDKQQQPSLCFNFCLMRKDLLVNIGSNNNQLQINNTIHATNHNYPEMQ